MRPAVLALLAALTGCSSAGGYFRDRALDLSDVVDLKYGAGMEQWGLGAKAEASAFAGAGLGAGNEAQVTEWAGREAERYRMGFFHRGLFGMDGSGGPCGPGIGGHANILGVQLSNWREGRGPS